LSRKVFEPAVSYRDIIVCEILYTSQEDQETNLLKMILGYLDVLSQIDLFDGPEQAIFKLAMSSKRFQKVLMDFYELNCP